MEELLPFLQKFEIWIYIFLGVVAFFPLQRLISAWRAWQGSVYGLEREIAQRRFSTALTMLVLLVLFIFVEFVIVSFVAPSYPQMAAFPTATLDLLATPTVTLPVAGAEATANPTGDAPGTQGAATQQPITDSCTPGQIEWVVPKSGEEISANVQLKGTVNVPNLGFYKYEFSKQGENLWTTIAGDAQPKVEGEIGFWNIDQIDNGDYLLRLVVTDNENNYFPACVIPVRIVKP
jgi:hypothetical protein